MTDKIEETVKTQTIEVPKAEAPVVAPVEAIPPLPPFKGLLGRKLGMTRIFDDFGRAVSATVIEAGPCHVVQVKTPSRDGYSAVTLGFGKPSKQQTNKARTGIFAKVGLEPTRTLREFRVSSADGFHVGQMVEASCFSKGEFVDISGVNKGKGFQGVVKRHRFGGGPRTHGQSDRLRAPGASGGQGPQRVTKGHRQPGHMGAEMSTVQAVRVLHIDWEHHVVAIEGAVPGPNGNFVVIKPTVKKVSLHVPQAHHATPPPKGGGAKAAAKPEKSKATPPPKGGGAKAAAQALTAGK
jgi:large subunit ribosomal protein L3